MTATLTPPEQVTQKVILDDISWETYQRLMEERGERPKPRYAYDRGRLEIMVISYRHANLEHDVNTLIEVLAEELELDIVGAGSTTFQREDLAQGFEPDASFYVRDAELIRGRKEIDLHTDPPPELVIEVDITSRSLNKFPIFAGLRIPEVWRFHKEILTIYVLKSGTYDAQDSSELFHGVTSEELTRVLSESLQTKRTEWLRNVREWARSLRR
jgi:Uma2 family endonuclease